MFERFKIGQKRTPFDVFEEGNRVVFEGNLHGSVCHIDAADQLVIPVMFEDTGETKMIDVHELTKLQRDVGHCHGCRKFQTLEMIGVQMPLHKNGAMFRWDCKHCGFRNAEFNPMKVDLPDNPHTLVCLTCSEKFTPVRGSRD